MISLSQTSEEFLQNACYFLTRSSGKQFSRLTLETGFLYFTSISALQLNWNDSLFHRYRQTTNTTDEQFQFISMSVEPESDCHSF